MSKSRQIFLAGVSSIALALSAPAVMAADLPTKAPPLAPAPPSPWTWWVEGGGQGVVGDPYVPGLVPPFDAKPNNWGWDVAGGFDYRFDGYWHIIGDFRYGQNQRNFNSFQYACIGTFGPFGCFTPISGPNTASRRESNWDADFMIGRDIGLGAGTSKLEGGLRIAEIRGTTDGNMRLVPTFGTAVYHDIYSQKNYFFGIGPRIALEGNTPLSGPWSMDYMFGVAGLFAHRSTNQVASFTGTPTACLPFGCALGAATSNNGAVFNPDAMVGIAYSISPTMKVAVNYHVDAYFAALRAFNATGSPTNVDRIYHGPSLRLTWQY